MPLIKKIRPNKTKLPRGRLTAAQEISGISHSNPPMMRFNAHYTSLIDKLFKTAICHQTHPVTTQNLTFAVNINSPHSSHPPLPHRQSQNHATFSASLLTHSAKCLAYHTPNRRTHSEFTVPRSPIHARE